MLGSLAHVYLKKWSLYYVTMIYNLWGIDFIVMGPSKCVLSIYSMLQTLERIKRTVDKILVVIYYQADGGSENSNLVLLGCCKFIVAKRLVDKTICRPYSLSSERKQRTQRYSRQKMLYSSISISGNTHYCSRRFWSSSMPCLFYPPSFTCKAVIQAATHQDSVDTWICRILWGLLQ